MKWISLVLLLMGWRWEHLSSQYHCNINRYHFLAIIPPRAAKDNRYIYSFVLALKITTMHIQAKDAEDIL